MLAYRRTDRPSAADVRASVELLFTAEPGQHAPVTLGVEAGPSAPMSPEALVALAERQYVRRPRWTPEVRYAEAIVATHHKVSEASNPGPDDFMD